MDACAAVPTDFAIADNHWAKCWLYADEASAPKQTTVPSRPV
jgi:hypothetical protein